jgi:AGCS family alanine or glycine:cation symporter
MAFPNIIGLLLLSGEVRSELKDYWAKVKSGEILKSK